MTEIIVTVLALILSNNLVLSLVKYLSFAKESKTWLRGALLVLSAVGIITTATLNGTPVDFDSLSSLGVSLAEMIVLAIGSHYSYKLIKLS